MKDIRNILKYGSSECGFSSILDTVKETAESLGSAEAYLVSNKISPYIVMYVDVSGMPKAVAEKYLSECDAKLVELFKTEDVAPVVVTIPHSSVRRDTEFEYHIPMEEQALYFRKKLYTLMYMTEDGKLDRKKFKILLAMVKRVL